MGNIMTSYFFDPTRAESQNARVLSITNYTAMFKKCVELGFKPSQCNLGVLPGNVDYGLWGDACKKCPNLDPFSTTCNGTNILSKRFYYELGEMVRDLGMG